LSRTQRHVGMAIAIVLLGINLRTLFSSLPPLVDDVRDALGLSAFAAGLLTTLPVLFFGALAPLAPRVAGAVPVERALTACALLTAVGAAMRGLGGVAPLYAGTLLAGVAIALAQTLVPVLIRARFPDDLGHLTGAFSMSLPLGATLGSALAVPLEHAFDGWEGSLAFWALPALLATIVWLPAALRPGTRVTGQAPGAALLRDPVAWSVAGFFGIQSMGFFAGLSWLPSILEDDGYSSATAGALQGVGNFLQLLPAFLLPVLAGRHTNQLGLLVGVVALSVAGPLGLLVAPDAAPLWVVVLGLGQGAALGLGLILPVLRGGDVRTVASLMAMTLSVGYFIASTGPWLLGLAHDVTGDWTVPLVILLLIGAAQLPVGLRAATGRTIGRVPA